MTFNYTRDNQNCLHPPDDPRSIDPAYYMWSYDTL